ncbi:MAG: hypothetical protein KDC07_11585, partial [Chitinophagaceae bacterium]|nr:hypothetical protein [Chitinophagaceae bacterium]
VPLIAIIVFKGVMSQTDPLTDRPDNPYGTLSACTTGTDIFTSDNSKIWIYLQQQEVLKEIGSVGAEGAAYTGIIIIAVLVVTVIIGLVYLIRRKKGAAYYHTEVEKIWFFIAFTVLLAGMGVPFVWKMDWLLDYLSAFRQFRSLGRFALIYYNIATISGVVLLYHWTKKISAKNKVAGLAILLLAGGIWAWEAKGFADRRRDRSMVGTYNYNYFTSKYEGSWNEFLEDNGYDSTDFQAIMTIPFVSVGSEKIWLFRGDWGGFCIATRASYQLKLPMISSIMSRSSWSRTFKQIKNASGPFGDRPTIDDMKSDKDFLLLDYEDYEKNPDESFYLPLADSIGHFHQYTVYRLSFDKLTKALASARQRGLEVADSLTGRDTSLAGMDHYYGHFDDLYKGVHFAGTGAQKQIQARDSVIFKKGVADWDKTQEYEVSIWALVNDFDYKGPLLELRCYNEANTEIGYFEFYANGSVYDTEDFWFRISRYFKMPEETKDITITTKYSGPDVYYAFDELLIRAAADTIVSKDGQGNILVNNHLLK